MEARSRFGIEVDLETGRAVIKIDLRTLSSDQDFRDRYIRLRMFPSSPIATFTVDDIGEIPVELYNGGIVTSRVEGSLNIIDVDVPWTFDVEVRKDGDLLFVLGRTSFTWDQAQIPVPSARSVISIEDEVKVKVLLQSPAQPVDGS